MPANPRRALSSDDTGEDLALASDAQEPHPARRTTICPATRGSEISDDRQCPTRLILGDKLNSLRNTTETVLSFRDHICETVRLDVAGRRSILN